MSSSWVVARSEHSASRPSVRAKQTRRPRLAVSYIVSSTCTLSILPIASLETIPPVP